MKFTDEFSVPAPREEVWPALLDLERVAPCLPGASLTGPSGDGYAGLMKVKLGPLLSSYKGTVEIKSSDQDSGLVVIRARGKDTTGQGVVEAMINATVSGNGAETLVAVETDLGRTPEAEERPTALDVELGALERRGEVLLQLDAVAHRFGNLAKVSAPETR